MDSPSGLFTPSVIENLDAPRLIIRRRWRLLYTFFSLICLIFISRSFYLQVWSGLHFRSQAENNRVAILPMMAPRGLIFDHQHKQLVENIASTDLVTDPATLNDQPQAAMIAHLAQLLSLPVEQIETTLEQTRLQQKSLPLAQALPHETTVAMQELGVSKQGLQLVSSFVRKYSNAYAAAHVLGYTSAVTVEELQNSESTLLTENTGKIGLEKKYDTLLRGLHGRLLTEVDAAGTVKRQVDQQTPLPGTDLSLALDIDFQQFAYGLLAERASKTETRGAAVVALEPATGAVRALLSYPSFDPNVFSQPALRDGIGPMIKAPDQPLFNRVTDGLYPPGSTIKPFLAVGALQEKIINPNTIVQSTGGIHIGPWFFPDWKTGGHGPTTIFTALAESVNTFFYMAVGGDETHNGLGVTRAIDYLRRFGWGQVTGIDLASEATGFLPSPEWKRQNKNEPWYIGDTYHLAIGQGDVLITPLQLATATAAIANGGYLVQPYMVEAYQPPDRAMYHTVPHKKKVSVESSHIETVREGMRQAVMYGSARSLADITVPIAGKTGTAQTGAGETTHAWFTSFGPYDTPELVITVLIEKGGAGDREAVPLAKQLWQWWIEHRQPVS